MPPAYDATIKTARMGATRNICADGTLEIGTAGMASVLAIFGLDATAGSVTGAVWTLGFDASTVTAIATGTHAAARIKDSGGTIRVTGLTSGTAGTDIVLSGATINTGQNVQLTSATVTHAA